jgi:hypothetical protein
MQPGDANKGGDLTRRVADTFEIESWTDMDAPRCS